MTEKTQRYARAQIVVHWLTLALLLVSFVSHESIKAAWDAITEGQGDDAFGIGVPVHVFTGLAVLALTLLRLVLRVRHGAPPPVAGQSPLITVSSAIVHGLLYVLLLAIPVTGGMAWFGGLEDLGEVHEVLFNLTLALVVLHVGAALFHQFLLKDNLLSRMR